MIDALIHRVERSLRRRISDARHAANPLARHGRHVDDAPPTPLDHAGHEGMRQPYGNDGKNLEDILFRGPIGPEEEIRHGVASIVDEYANGHIDRCDQLLDGITIRKITWKNLDLHPMVGSDLAGQRFKSVTTAGREHEWKTQSREVNRIGLADA